MKVAEADSAPLDVPDELDGLASVGDSDHPEKRNRGRHDPATYMLIDAELRDASPEERKEWLAYLETMESSVVPYVLRARRIESGRSTQALAKDSSIGKPGEMQPPGPTDAIHPAGHIGQGAGTVSQAGARKSPELPTVTPRNEGPAGTRNNQSELSAPEPATGLGWTKKVRQLGEWDTKGFWPSGGDDADAHSSGEPALAAKRAEKSGFGFPAFLGANRQEPAPLPLPAQGQEPLIPESRTEPAVPPLSGSQVNRIDPDAEVWEDELHKLISLLEAETAPLTESRDADLPQSAFRQQLALRLLYLIGDQPQRAQQVIAGIPANEQEFWTALFVSLSSQLAERGDLDGAERATETVRQLRAATYHLQRGAGLQLRNVTFCSRINDFGDFDPMESDVFRPGEPVLIYAEVRNFASEPTVDGHYRTSIRSSIDISRTTNTAELVDHSKFEPTEDLSRTLRTDYYHSYRIDLPPQLMAGPHVLTLTITDETTGKTATQTLPFRVQE